MGLTDSVDKHTHTPVMDSLRRSVITTMERVLKGEDFKKPGLPPPPSPIAGDKPPSPVQPVDESKTVTLGGFKFKQSAKKASPKELHLSKEDATGTVQIVRRPYRAHQEQD